MCDRSTFIGTLWGDEERAMRQVLEMAKGGVLMVDEAYLLNGRNDNDPGKLVIQLLMNILADETQRDLAIVLCGYKDKLDKMIDQNPGLYSRFVNRFEFKDYTLDELTEIGIRYLKTFGHTFSTDGLACFREELAAAMSGSNTKTWANARSVKNMIEHTYIRRAMRYAKEGHFKREIIAEDISTIPTDNRCKIGF